IFDYWAIPSIAKWAGADKTYRKARLSKAEQKLREWYQSILTLANTNQAFQRGSFYDLTYCNFDNPDYDVHRQFAFLRQYGREVVLVVANFDAADKTVRIQVPEEAWNFVGVTGSRRRHFQDLITGEWNFIHHDITKPFEQSVRGNDVAVIRFQTN
ncbi:MAG: hypothetical protein J6U31_03550, partial [Bacteroidales bacterium]|nr:hypothetical protein [Bacteroidales bacterium]